MIHAYVAQPYVVVEAVLHGEAVATDEEWLFPNRSGLVLDQALQAAEKKEALLRGSVADTGSRRASEPLHGIARARARE
jgi:hypothetical protein